jgi:hypothetical protein
MKSKPGAGGENGIAFVLVAALGMALLAGCHGTFQRVSGVGGSGGTTVDSTALTEMTLSPTAVTVAPSSNVQYTVTGKLGDGVVVAPVVTFVTTGGGTITSDGFFTAGSTPGTELVIATQTGGPTGNPPCCTDTSVVTVSIALERSLVRRAGP